MSSRRRHQSRSRPQVRAAAWLTLMLTIGLLAGCGDGGGGSSEEPSTPAAAPAAVIDLPPGQTSAQLGWQPSLGPVDGYVVLQARNGGGWVFLDRVREPHVEVHGQPGESIQITVIAQATNAVWSKPSAPSPVLRFSAAPPPPPPSHQSPVAAVSSVLTPAQDLEPVPVPAKRARVADVSETAQELEGSPEAPPQRRLALPERLALLRSDPRFPVAGLSERAAHWLAERIDGELLAGVALVGTGRADADGMSELVWQDASGQLFVSDGALASRSDDLAGTLEEAVRLRATERFVALADLDGDGLGDWVLEETTTGDVWIIDGASGETRPALAEIEPGSPRLAGQGDLDGDGRFDLLWRREDGSIALGLEREGGNENGLERVIREIPSIAAEDLLAIADLDGDGVDDLVTLDAEDRLEILFMRPGSPQPETPGFERMTGPDSRLDGFELLAALDLAGDGGAELVFLVGESLEIWGAFRGLLEGIQLE